MTGHPDPVRTLIRGVILAPYLVGAVIYAPALVAAALAVPLVALVLLPYAPGLRARPAGVDRRLRHHRA